MSNSCAPSFPSNAVNVLVGDDGAVTSVPSHGALPALSTSSRLSSYGALPDGRFERLLELGATLSLAPASSLYEYSKTQRRALTMFADLVNFGRGGLNVSGVRYGVRFTFVDDGGDPRQSSNATAHASRLPPASFLFGSFSSSLSTYGVLQAEAEGKIIMLPGSSLPSVFDGSERAFGLLPNGSTYARHGIAAIAARGRQLREGRGHFAGLRAAFVQIASQAQQLMCSGAVEAAREEGMALARDELGRPLVLEIAEAPAAEEARRVALRLQQAGANVIVGCTFFDASVALIDALHEVDLSPSALLLTSTVDQPAYESLVRGGWHRGEYALGLASWHHTRPGRGAFSGLTSAEFASAFASNYGGSAVSYQGAASFAAACSLAAAIESAGTLSTARVAAALREQRLAEFYATITYARNGQLAAPMAVLQYLPPAGAALVAPAEAAAARLAFPAPTWAARRCAAAAACGDHGACAEGGGCECFAGYAGAACDAAADADGGGADAALLGGLAGGAALLGALLAGGGVWGAAAARRRRRREVRLLSHDDGSHAKKVTFVTDIEGNWEYFAAYVERCEALRFEGGAPAFDERGGAAVVLEEGWCFVHGGDACDKGGVVGGSIRVVQTLCRLKRRYPDRVVLLLGNRDLNKLRMTSELQVGGPLYRRQLVGGAPWVPAGKRVSPELFLRRRVAEAYGCAPEAVPEAAVDAADTLPNRIRWMYKETMGADGEFERQWGELALLRRVRREALSEEEVAAAILRAVLPGGGMRELLELGQLAFIHGGVLFVHGGLIGGAWEGSEGGVHCFGYVPGRAERLEHAVEWVQALNEWKQAQFAEWIRQPYWRVPADGGAPSRGGEAIMAYVCPGCVPSVVMGRHLDRKGMPLPLPPPLAAALRGCGVSKLAVGHTPHGNAPTLVRSADFLVVMADTSYSDMSAVDSRGHAVSEVQFLLDGSVAVSGVLHDGREIRYCLEPASTQLVGYSLPAFPAEAEAPPEDLIDQATRALLDDKPYFVKAWLPKEQLYLLCNVDGFIVSYITLGQHEVERLFELARARGAGGELPQAVQAQWLRKAEEVTSPASPGIVQAVATSTRRGNGNGNGNGDGNGHAREAASDGPAPPAGARRARSTSLVECSSLGDWDIVGLTGAHAYAHKMLEEHIQHSAREGTGKVLAQARNVLRRFPLLQSETAVFGV